VVLKLLPIPPKKPLPPYSGSGDEPWHLTGQVKFKSGIFRPILYVEEQRFVRGERRSPGVCEMIKETRLRRAKRSDIFRLYFNLGAA
jgi:hypothetical protein